MLYVYGNRQNLGHDPQGRERALEPRRARPLGDPPPRRRGADRGLGARRVVPQPGRRGRRLLLPPLPVGRGRAHAPLLARPAQDAADDRRRRQEDGRLRRHGARAQGDGLRQGRRSSRPRRGASGRPAPATSRSPRSQTTSRSASSASTSSRSLRGDGDRIAAAREGLAVVRALEQLQSSLERERV